MYKSHVRAVLVVVLIVPFGCSTDDYGASNVKTWCDHLYDAYTRTFHESRQPLIIGDQPACYELAARNAQIPSNIHVDDDRAPEIARAMAMLACRHDEMMTREQFNAGHALECRKDR